MSKVKHSPGPWRLIEDGGFTVRDIDLEFVTYLPASRHPEGLEDKEAEANACLIAAAPDLLAALEAALSVGQIVGGSKEVAKHVVAKAKGQP